MRKKSQEYRRNILKVSGSFGRELADDHNHVIATECYLTPALWSLPVNAFFSTTHHHSKAVV